MADQPNPGITVVPAGAAPAGSANVDINSPAPAATGSAVEFEKLIPADYREKPYMKNIKSVDDLFKNFDGAQSLMGKRIVPDANAPEEEWNKFYAAAGRPEKPENYEFTDSEDVKKLGRDPKMVEGVKSLMHKAGLSPRQAKILQEGYDALTVAQLKTMNEGAAQLDTDFEALAGKTFGARKDAVLAASQALIKENTPEALKPYVAQLPNEALIVLASVLDGVSKKYIGEDRLPGSGAAAGGKDADALQNEGQVLMASEAYRNAWHKDHDETVTKVNQIYTDVGKMRQRK